MDISFGGGTLAEFVVAMQKAAEQQATDPTPINVILRDEAKGIPIPAVVLRRVTPEAAFEAACPRGLTDLDLVRSGGAPIIVIEAKPLAIKSAGARDGSGGGSARDARQQPPMLRVYSVRDFVDNDQVTYKVLLDAMRTALEADDSASAAEVLHHESSGVLIVRGNLQQQVVAEQTLDAIRTDTRTVQEMQRRYQQQSDILKQRLISGENQIRRSEMEIQAAAEQLDQTMALAEKDFASQQQVLESKRALDAAMLQRELAQSELQVLRTQYDALQSEYDMLAQKHAAQATTTSTTVEIRTPQLETTAKLFQVLSDLLKSSGSNASISVLSMKKNSDSKLHALTVEFEGDQEAAKHFKAMCNLVSGS